jgi:hypothetical protein
MKGVLTNCTVLHSFATQCRTNRNASALNSLTRNSEQCFVVSACLPGPPSRRTE